MSLFGELLGFLFGDEGALGGLSIKTGLTPQKWRPGRRSTEIRARRAKMAQQLAANTGQLKAWLEKERQRIRNQGQIGKFTPPKAAPSPANAAGGKLTPAAPPRPNVALPRPLPITVPPKNAVNVAGTPRLIPPIVVGTAPRRSAGVSMMGLLERSFFDGMGDPSSAGLSTGSSSGGGNTVIDPITGQPIELPPGYTLDANGNLVPADPAPPTDENGKPYTGNAQVWVSAKAIPFYWDALGELRARSTGGGAARAAVKLSDPVLYPDGTPVTGLVWLPRINLESMAPDMFRPFTRAVIESGTRTWPEGDGVDYWYAHELPGYQYKGTHSIKGDDMRLVEAGRLRAPWGPVEPWGPRAEAEYKKGADAFHDGATVYYMGCSFDWSANDPSTAAYPFLYDWFAAEILQWRLMPADLWLSTGTPISNAQQGVYLPYQPSPLLHCLDFLDALATGAHGMPQVLDLSVGRLDFDGLAAWCSQDPKWAQLGAVISAAKQRPFMVATIYDVTEVAVGPGVNSTQGVAPLPAPAIDPLPPLAPDDGTGLPVPYDPSYDPYSNYVDWSQPSPVDPNAPQFVDYGPGDYEPPDFGPGYPIVTEAPGYAPLELVEEEQYISFDDQLPSVEMGPAEQDSIPLDDYEQQDLIDEGQEFVDDYEWAQRWGGRGYF